MHKDHAGIDEVIPRAFRIGGQASLVGKGFTYDRLIDWPQARVEYRFYPNGRRQRPVHMVLDFSYADTDTAIDLRYEGGYPLPAARIYPCGSWDWVISDYESVVADQLPDLLVAYEASVGTLYLLARRTLDRVTGRRQPPEPSRAAPR